MAFRLDKKIIYAFDDKRYVYLLYREEGKKKIHVIEDFEWYFCIPLEDLEISGVRFALKRYLSLGVVVRAVKDSSYVKVYCNRWSDLFNDFITELKLKLVKCLEMDLSLTKRFLIDNHIELEENLKIGYFDIETDDSGQGIEIGRDPILSWAIVSEEGKVRYCSLENEREMLVKFLNAMDQFDVLVGWNSLKFDVPYLKARMELNGLQYATRDGVSFWKRTMQVDLMMRYVKLFAPIMSILGLSGFSLNEMSRLFLKKSKVEHSQKIHEMFKENPELLKKYNVQDCNLVRELNLQLQTLNLMIKECVWTGSFLDKFYVGELLDNYILRETKKKRIYLNSRPNKQEEDKNRLYSITGGYVQDPLVGFYNNVRVFDFKSLYPTIMIGYNLGEDTHVLSLAAEGRRAFNEFLAGRDIEKVDFLEWLEFLKSEKKRLDPDDKYYQTTINQFFMKDRKSIVAELLENLLSQRKVYKKRLDSLAEGSTEFINARSMQEVVKELTNSMFGITADPSSRYFNSYFSESITYTGQFWNRLSTYLFEKHMGLKTLYADTDSVFLQIDDDNLTEQYHEKINSLLNEFVKEFFSLHPDKDLIDLEYEKNYGKLILLDKKRYIGKMVWSNGKRVDFIHSRGTENVKKDTIPFTKKKIIEMVEKIISGMTEEESKEYILSLREWVFAGNLKGEDLVIVKKLSRPIASYKVKTAHVKLAERLLKENKIMDTVEAKHSWGERIFFLITDFKDKEKGFMLASDYAGEKLDLEYYWKVHIFSPLKRILSAVYPSFNWSLYEKPILDNLQSSLL